MSRRDGLPLSCGFVAISLGAALLAMLSPIRFSIVTVFLFAGPHNWLEIRYILGRLPARLGKLRGFFLLSFLGIIGLTVAFAAIPWCEAWDLSVDHLYRLWNGAFLAWIALLVRSRAHTNPRFDSSWIPPIALVVIGISLLAPETDAMALVYLHPMMAMILLDRELQRSHRNWRRTYHLALGVIPVLLVALWFVLGKAPDLPGGDPLTFTITNHAGAGVFEGVSTHFLVAAHTFLEMVHYGIWVLLMPLVVMKSQPLNLESIPIARRSGKWFRAVALFLAVGAGIVVTLWIGFFVDYETTRTIYFTIAMMHVLAEIPFLLRMV